MSTPSPITSRDNPLLKRLRLLAQDSTAYRKQGQVWLEGDHLCRALLARGHRPATAGWRRFRVGPACRYCAAGRAGRRRA